MNEELSDIVLLDLGEDLGADWERVGIHLGMSSADIYKAKANNRWDVGQQAFSLLVSWRNRTGHVNRRELLATALGKTGRQDLIDNYNLPVTGDTTSQESVLNGTREPESQTRTIKQSQQPITVSDTHPEHRQHPIRSGVTKPGSQQQPIIPCIMVQDYDKQDVFLSYQWDSQETVNKLYSQLTQSGFRCWMDIHTLGGGDALFEEIENGLRKAQVFVACITRAYADSENCQKESTLADQLKKPIIPILLERHQECWPPNNLAMIYTKKIFISFVEDSDFKGSRMDQLKDRITGVTRKYVYAKNSSESRSNHSTSSSCKSPKSGVCTLF